MATTTTTTVDPAATTTLAPTTTCAPCMGEETTKCENLCETTTFVPPEEAPIEGTVTGCPIDLTYCCDPIGIPTLEPQICADGRCDLLCIEVAVAPENGKLCVLNCTVEEGESLAPSANGVMVYIKEEGFVGEDTFELKAVTSCGESENIVVTITAEDVFCGKPSPCGCNE